MKRKQIPKNSQDRRSEAGFTLIELSIVLIILSVTLAAFGSAFMQYLATARDKAVHSRMDEIEGALSRFLALNGRYPCVAPLDAAPDTSTYGMEISTDCSNAALVGSTSRAAGTAARQVRIGAVPVRSLNLPDEYANDAWGMRIVYAVTEILASPGTFQQDEGGISVVDTGDNTVITPAGSAHYVIYSSGPDGLGSYSVQGLAGVACNTSALDGENCDNDATYRATVLYSTSGTNSNYDDYIRYIGAQSLDDDIPAGAVVPFNLATCPPGWAAYGNAVGRMVVGAGSYSENYNPGGRTAWSASANYTLGAQGGFMTWRQNISEMPAHHHGIRMRDYEFYEPIVGWSYDYRLSGEGGGSDVSRTTMDVGADTPTENRPPYVALLYCQKL